MACEEIQLRRNNTGQSWGFKMQGGVDVGMPLFVAHVSPNSISGIAGLRAGDGILKIGKVDTTAFSHEQARGEMIRSGNEIDLTVRRGVINAPQEAGVEEEERPRMSVSGSDAESPYGEVQPKSYKVLEKELDDLDRAPAAGRPASIFDKKRQNRSNYTKAEGSGYLKPYGQQN